MYARSPNPASRTPWSSHTANYHQRCESSRWDWLNREETRRVMKLKSYYAASVEAAMNDAAKELGPDAMAVLLSPKARVSFRFVNAMCLALLAGLGRANRVLARAELERRQARDGGDR